MSEASLRLDAAGVLHLEGVLEHAVGPRLREQGRALITASPVAALVLDCAAVQRSNSVGLSLLLAFMRDAAACGKTVEVRGLPRDMLEIARVSGLRPLLGLPD